MIQEFSVIPNRTQPPSVFSANVDTFLSEINRFVSEANSTANNVTNSEAQAALSAQNAQTSATNAANSATQAANYATQAANSATQAANYAEEAQNTAHSAISFKGLWSSLSGALTIPASVWHDGVLWILLYNISNVQNEVPGVSPAWGVLARQTSRLSAFI